MPGTFSRGAHPRARPRRLRAAPWRRALTAETQVAPSDLIWPLFVIEGRDHAEPIASMPGVSRLTIDRAVAAAERAASLGVPCVALFPSVAAELKTADCAEAWNPENLVCRAVRAIKDATPEIGVMVDVALDPYNALGHDGLVEAGEIVNDRTVAALVRQALAQAEAGADVIGPSDMMDGRIAAIRDALEAGGHQNALIMSYAAKYASSFYGPFRDAVGAAGRMGRSETDADGPPPPKDKKTYQMDASNSDEALREVAMDLDEGADMVMIKPGLPYLDICRRVKDAFAAPTYAYQVSGEYAMIEAASAQGWIDREAAMLESLAAFKRAGCDGVLTYYAVEAAQAFDRGRRRP